MDKAVPNALRSINGSLYEGGGQKQLALSTITGFPVEIHSIRDSRPNPGLNRQLQTGINVMNQISNCDIEGNRLNAKKVLFMPKEIRSGSFKGDCQSAGSIALMTQMILPTLLFGKETTTVLLKGGTAVSKSPSVRYFEKILFPVLQKFGIQATIKIDAEGFYPWGGGQAEIQVQPLTGKTLTPINITQTGKINNVYIQVITKENNEAAGNEYLKEIRKTVKKIMRTKYSEEEVDAIDFDLDYHYSENLMRAGLKAKVKQAKANKGKDYHPENKGPKAIVYGVLLFAYGDGIYYDCSCVCHDDIHNDDAYVEKVLNTFDFYFKSGSCMDEHLQDQLLIFMLLANGNLRSNEFFPNFEYKLIEDKEAKLTTIEFTGIGAGQTAEPTKIEEPSKEKAEVDAKE